MRDVQFDFLTRRTVAALDRRSVFGVLGGVLAAATIAAPEGEAKKNK